MSDIYRQSLTGVTDGTALSALPGWSDQTAGFTIQSELIAPNSGGFPISFRDAGVSDFQITIPVHIPDDTGYGHYVFFNATNANNTFKLGFERAGASTPTLILQSAVSGSDTTLDSTPLTYTLGTAPTLMATIVKSGGSITATLNTGETVGATIAGGDSAAALLTNTKVGLCVYALSGLSSAGRFGPMLIETVGGGGGGDTAPAAPVLADVDPADVTPSGFPLSWTDDDTATSFRIEWDTDAGFPAPASTTIDAADAATASLAGLAANTPYYVRVIGINDAGESDPSNVILVTTGDASDGTPPATLVAGILSKGSISGTDGPLSWTVATGGTAPYNYTVQAFRQVEDGTDYDWADIGDVGTATTHNVDLSSLVGGERSDPLRVKVTDADSTLAYTNTVRFLIPIAGGGTGLVGSKFSGGLVGAKRSFF